MVIPNIESLMVEYSNMNTGSILGKVSLIIIAGFFPVASVSAQTQTAEDLQIQIDALLAQIAELQIQVDVTGEQDASVGVSGIPAGFTFDTNLSQGSSSQDVMYLQMAFNANSDTQLAASGVGSAGNETQFFGPLTRAAAVKYQEKFTSQILTPVGLSSGTGFVGPSTRAQLNSWLAVAPAPPPPKEPTPLVPSEVEGEPEVELDTTPPAISHLQVLDIGETSARITWTTDESADSKVSYAASSPISAAITTDITELDSVTNHSIDLSNLVSGTTYYYITVSRDVEGNEATSQEQTFTTLAQPVSPSIIGSISDATLLQTARSVYVSGDYAYVVAQNAHRLTILDISNPNSPLIVSTLADAVQLQGAASVYVVNNLAYIAVSKAHRLTVVDVSDISSPSIIGTIGDADTLEGAASVYVIGSYAYVAAATADRLTVVDISDPTSPMVVGSQKSTQLDGAISVYVSGDYAYVAAEVGNRLTIVKISSPSSPSIVGSIRDAVQLEEARSVYVSGDYAYVAAHKADRLVVVDISSPSSPSIVGSIKDTQLDGASAVYVSGSYAYVGARLANRLVVVDISDSNSPFILTSLSDATRLQTARSVFVVGNLAYVAARNSSRLTIVDLFAKP
ncbi:fibronectin type III domain-containing protein [Patescibacteria group bacterium]|nr:fibronectin type III domain-containing protein [Patescibacteria group bacterium]